MYFCKPMQGTAAMPNESKYNSPQVPTAYRGRQYRSRLEAKWAAFFDLVGWPYEYEPCDLNGWFPAFALCGKNRDSGNAIILCEIKPITKIWIGVFIAAIIICGLLLFQQYQTTPPAETWRGLTVAPEQRCTPYARSDYPYSSSLESRLVKTLGNRIYSPYTKQVFTDLKQTHIDHIVAMSEAHDSGLCAAPDSTRRAFAADLLNLTLASPAVNGCRTGGKCAKDAAEWLPPHNQCWFAARIVEVRRKYHLTIDRREAAALDRVLAACPSTAMIGPEGDFAVGTLPDETPPEPAEGTPLSRWDDNGNGRITCKEARRHGIAPVPRSHPAYPFMRDGDGDGMVCE